MEFDWDAANVAHIARHGITPEECEEAYWNAPDGDRGAGKEARTPQAVPGGDQRGHAADVRDRRTQGQDPVRHRAPDAHETTGDLPGGRNDASQDQDSGVPIGKGRSRVVGRASGGRYGAVPEGEEGREDQAAARDPRGYQIHDDPAADRRY